MAARGDNQTRKGNSQRSWAGVSVGAKAVPALLLAKFVASTAGHCIVLIEPVVKAACCSPASKIDLSDRGTCAQLERYGPNELTTAASVHRWRNEGKARGERCGTQTTGIVVELSGVSWRSLHAPVVEVLDKLGDCSLRLCSYITASYWSSRCSSRWSCCSC